MQVTFGHGAGMQLASWGSAGQGSPTCGHPSEWSRCEVHLPGHAPYMIALQHHFLCSILCQVHAGALLLDTCCCAGTPLAAIAAGAEHSLAVTQGNGEVRATFVRSCSPPVHSGCCMFPLLYTQASRRRMQQGLGACMSAATGRWSLLCLQVFAWGAPGGGRLGARAERRLLGAGRQVMQFCD